MRARATFPAFLLEAVIGAIGCSAACSASSTLFSGGTIISYDVSQEAPVVIRDGSLLVTKDSVAGIYNSPSPPDLPRGTVTVNCTGKILTPGFIDTHKHAWQTAFKTLASNATLAEYFVRYGEFATVGLLSADDVYLGQIMGLYESLNSGTTTILDHAHHTWSETTSIAGLQASIDSQARVMWAHAFHNVTNYTVSDQLPVFRSIAEKAIFNNTATQLAVAYDSVGATPFNKAEHDAIWALVQEFKIPVMTSHLVAGPYGNPNTPTTINNLGWYNTSMPYVLSHASFIQPNDALVLRSANQYIATCAESESHYGHLHTDSHLIGDQQALGVDTHFTYSGDLLTQARIWLQTTRYRLYEEVTRHWEVPGTSPMSVNQAFKLATRNGALALRRPDLGVLTVGAKADIVVWNGDSPAMVGWNDPVAAVILHASVADVEHVMVDGIFVKRDFKLKAKNYTDIRQRFQASAKAIQAKMIAIPLPPHTGFSQGVHPLGQPWQVDVVRGDGTGYGQQYLTSG
ncbi:hypothetical protein GQ53DRAFT_845054 [Thozetella sp. PMI_491]|nr:hypothetical protein GQ53DRAFT_845054 [Thozetella sp. PMI_491]